MRIKDVEREEFMTTIGHDDIFDPQFLEIMKDVILRFPDASLYQTGARFINAKGKRIRACVPVPERETASQFLRARLAYQRDMFGTGYVMRSTDYDRVGGIPAFEKLCFADDALWLQLSKQSWKAADPRQAVGVRIHPASESASSPSIWPVALKSLEQFTNFLEQFIETDKHSRLVYEQYGPGFLSRYYRNILIYALVEACQQKKRIDEGTLQCIYSSFEQRVPARSEQLAKETKIRVLRFLNQTRLRPLVNWSWGVYYLARTTSL